jgi:(p)ppGpp synthase/HD superfamily hydrolase
VGIKLFLNFDDELSLRLGNYENKRSRAEELWVYLTKKSNIEQRLKLNKLRNYIEKLQFTHLGFNQNDYFLHILRVASIAGIINTDHHILSTKIGFLHNIYEVTDLDSSQISRKFGNEIKEILNILKINRRLQNNKEYLNLYYEGIYNLPFNSGVVKVLDKLDNLYSLNETATPEIKENYLLEIDEYIVPLCKKVAPHILPTLSDTINKVKFLPVNRSCK